MMWAIIQYTESRRLPAIFLDPFRADGIPLRRQSTRRDSSLIHLCDPEDPSGLQRDAWTGGFQDATSAPLPFAGRKY